MFARLTCFWLTLVSWGIAENGTDPKRYLFEGLSLAEKGLVIAVSGSLWWIDLEDGSSKALTSGSSRDQLPVVHPKGHSVAFMRASPQGGNIMVLDFETNKIRQLTFHPSRNWPITWSQDGKRLLFASRRDLGPSPRLFEMDFNGGWPEPLPLRMGSDGTWLPDGRLIYVPHSRLPEFSEFRYYRGGIMSPLWIVEPMTGEHQALTQAKSNAYQPVWANQQLYYLDDKDGTANLYAHDLSQTPGEKLTNFQTHGIRSMDALGSRIAFTRHGRVFLLDQHQKTPRDITPEWTLPTRRNQMRTVNARRWVTSMSWTHGDTLCLNARGDVFLRDLNGTKSKNITQSSGSAERLGQLSPNGKNLAYFSDAQGAYALVIRDIATDKETFVSIEEDPSLYEELTWSPDSRQLCFSSRRLTLWHFQLGQSKPVPIAQSPDPGQISWRPDWSPNGNLLVYQRRAETRLPSIFIFDTVSKTHHRVSDGDLHASMPIFDASGRYVYFLVSPQAPAIDFNWGLLSASQATASVETYLAAARIFPTDRAPLVGNRPNLDLDWDAMPDGQGDLRKIQKRVTYLNVGQHQISELWPGSSGVLYLLASHWRNPPHFGEQPALHLYRVNLRNPQAMERIARDVSRALVNPVGDKLLYESRSGWRRLRYEKGAWHREAFSLGTLAKPVLPHEEWAQLFEDSWRIAAEMFYDPHLHGQDSKALLKDYRSYLPQVSNRHDLTLLLRRMLGHLSVSHIQVGSGDSGRSAAGGEIGLLGASIETDQNRYRFTKVYRQPPLGIGHPDLIAPLDQPGSRIADGEYLLAIDDEPVFAEENLFERMWQRAGQWVRLTVGPEPDGQISRTIRIRALSDETDLRRAHWVAENRKKVAQLSDGQVGYLYISAYNPAGIRDFMRGYFAQRHKRGLIIDQRDNSGGTTSDALIELITRQPLYAYRFRQGADLAVPVNAPSGSQVLINNFWNASAAETFALMFQNAAVGPIVGNATFGAGIGPWGWRHQLIDGARIQVPNRAAYHPDGHWGIENIGVKPDVPIIFTPMAWSQGRDPYLEAAVKAALDTRPPKYKLEAPAFPIHPR